MPQDSIVLRALNNEGMFYAIEIKTWPARARIDAQELGLPPELDKSLYSLGSKRLITKEHLAAIDNARANGYKVLQDAQHTQGFFGFRFVRLAHVGKIEEALEEARIAFYRAVDDFIREYPNHIEEMHMLWQKEVRKLFPEDEYKQRMSLTQIMGAYPDPVAVRARFKFNWSSFAFALPNTELATRFMEANEAEKAAGALKKAQDRMISQFEDMIRGDITVLEESIRDLCAEVINTAENSPSGLHQKTVNRIRTEIERLRSMNYTDASSVNNALQRLERITQEDAKVLRERTNGVASFKTALGDIQQQMQVALEANKDEALRGFLRTGRRQISTAKAPF